TGWTPHWSPPTWSPPAPRPAGGTPSGWSRKPAPGWSAATPTDRGSHDLRRGVAGRQDRPPDRYRQQQHEPGHEEHHQRHDRRPVVADDLVHHAEQQRTQPAGTLVGDAVEAEVLRLPAGGDELAEQRPGQRLAAAEYQPDRRAEQHEQQ